VSDNGEFFTFMSSEDLTGYDTRDAVTGAPDDEVYLFEASENRLICASCEPTGGRPVGVPYNGNELAAGVAQLNGTDIAANLPPSTNFSTGLGDGHRFLYQTRYLANSGRLFFDSPDPLVAQDVNGTQDVYEFEPPGVGGCGATSATYSERSGGCVGLISSGSSAEESAFMDASESGDDVFFITLAKLVSQDYDAALDVYDAHVCSGAEPCYPAATAVPPACFTGDACKAAPTPQPTIFAAPPSATFNGVGDVSPATPVTLVKPRAVTRAQRLARALKLCGRRRGRRRVLCEREAHKRYGSSARKSNRKSVKTTGGR
jgi:hypothetical protein